MKLDSQRSDQDQIFLWLNEQSKGPYTRAQIAGLWMDGRLPKQILFTRNNAKTWEPVELILPECVEASKQERLNREAKPGSQDTPLSGLLVDPLLPGAGFECLGWICVVLGVLIIGFFFLVYDPTVSAQTGTRVVNLARISSAESGVNIGCAVMLLGGILLIVDKLKKLEAKP